MYYILVKDGVFFVVSPDMTEVNRFLNYDEAQVFCNNLNLMSSNSNGISNPNFGVRSNFTTEFGTSEFTPSILGMNKLKPNNMPLVNYGEIVFNYGEDMTQEHNNLLHNTLQQSESNFIVNPQINHNCNHHDNNQTFGCEFCGSNINYNNSLNVTPEPIQQSTPAEETVKIIEEDKKLTEEEKKLKELEIRENLERLKVLEKMKKNNKQKATVKSKSATVVKKRIAPESVNKKALVKEERLLKKEDRNISDSDEFLTTEDIKKFITKLKK
ncbi:hypothetical protein [Spiroplasma cantharicola]|uniref:Uncharacterized protein n=1 Tax=Spiroplasma cantharicola TaxID=362837 RepID=A0A0M4JSQ7_9MOLU|nr:hypothetical protein [Spiroplasma cantharicola]ALD66459.1 hypothetical protein SCANT_v1c05530 [Spiroplasma cantharicola]